MAFTYIEELASFTKVNPPGSQTVCPLSCTRETYLDVFSAVGIGMLYRDVHFVKERKVSLTNWSGQVEWTSVQVSYDP